MVIEDLRSLEKMNCKELTKRFYFTKDRQEVIKMFSLKKCLLPKIEHPKKIKLLFGHHFTTTERRHILQILSKFKITENFISFKVGRKEYKIRILNTNIYQVNADVIEVNL